MNKSKNTEYAFTDASVNAFLDDINIEIAPVLILRREYNGGDDYFRLYLGDTIYALSDQVTAVTNFRSLVDKTAMKYFNKCPEFNNTAQTFWFN